MKAIARRLFHADSLIVLVALIVSSVECSEKNQITEARGKAKYALLIHFFYVAATKLFILKIVYGIIFFVLLSKGWHFALWFIHYIKQKKEHVEYIEPEPIHHSYHDHGFEGFDHHGYEPYHGYDQPYHGYGKPSFGEYELDDKKRIYDADGSYSVKNYKRA
ncbi:hypothetical protein evm_012192 [Chilo suppressalis]|nr:hypothetical protein evm_012192 [Chilo suppressalis]